MTVHSILESLPRYYLNDLRRKVGLLLQSEIFKYICLNKSATKNDFVSFYRQEFYRKSNKNILLKSRLNCSIFLEELGSYACKNGFACGAGESPLF